MGMWGGKAENIEKKGCREGMEEKSTPAPLTKTVKGAAPANPNGMGAPRPELHTL